MGSSDVSPGDTILASQQADLRDDVIDQITAKGDLMIGTAADTMARLAALANGHVLMTASGEATGLKWGLLHKLDATVAPDADNDTTEGYEPGSIWVDVTADKAYICLDATDTAAVWTDITTVQTAIETGSRTAATGAGTQNVTGAGFTPKGAVIFMRQDDSPTGGGSWGFIDEADVNSMIAVHLDFASFNDAAKVGEISDGSSALNAVAALTADGLDFTWSKFSAGQDVHWTIWFIG